MTYISMHFKLQEDFVVVWDVIWLVDHLVWEEMLFLRKQHLVYGGKIVVWDVECADENFLKMI